MALGKLFIGLKVRELRVASQQTQSQFAKRIGISTSYLNQIENNQRSVSAAVLLQLADKFNPTSASCHAGRRTGCSRRSARRSPIRSSRVSALPSRNSS
jgi:transcriptional regulator with XRE-family HTH domain